MSEHRKATRLSWNKNVILIRNNKQWHGAITEVSMKNALINTNKTDSYEVGDDLDFIIELSGDAENFRIEGKAVVKRIVLSDQIAVEFYSIDLNSYATLKELLTYNFGNDSIIQNDLQKLFSSYLKD